MKTHHLVLATALTATAAVSLLPNSVCAEERQQAAPSACRAREACRIEGRCTLEDDRCVAASDADCAYSEFCRHGKCHAREGRCVVLSEDDCRRALVCFEKGWCALRDGACQPHVAREWNSPDSSGSGPMVGTGIVLTALGGVAILGGAGLLFSSMSEAMACEDASPEPCEERTSSMGAIVMAAGFAAIGVGIPLWVVGARSDEPSDEREREGGIELSLTVAPTARYLGLVATF